MMTGKVGAGMCVGHSSVGGDQFLALPATSAESGEVGIARSILKLCSCSKGSIRVGQAA